MASRRTRLKASKTPGSSETRHAGMRSKGLSPSKSKSSSTPAGPKAVKRLKTNARATLNKSNISSCKKESQDAYEFDESDDFITGDSFPSTNSRKKATKNVSFRRVAAKSNSLKGSNALKVKKEGERIVKMARQERLVEKDAHKKKTSTPLLSDSVNSPPRGKKGSSMSRVRRSPRIVLPKLNLDLSVTPILPVTDGTPPSPKTKAKLDHNPKVVSFAADPETKASQETPTCPGAKVKSRTSLRCAAVAVYSSESLTQANPAHFAKGQVVSKVSVAIEKKDLKRKHSDSNPLTVKSVTASRQVMTSTSAKRPKANTSRPTQSKSASKQQNQKSSKLAVNQQSEKKQTYLNFRQPAVLPSSKTATTRQRKPATTSTPAHQAEDEGRSSPTPSLGDSGISFGSDSGTSRTTDASGTPSFPGFMEDEPLQSELQDLYTSPFSSSSSTSSSTNDPESALNKSSSTEYKAGKTKREKGRYSTSKLDAWASAANQSLEEVESFELVVE